MDTLGQEGVAALLYILLFVIGIALHVGYFNQGEHHMYGARYLLVFSALQASTFACITTQTKEPISTSLEYTLLGSLSLLSGIFTSLAVYRTFLHPLRSFPSPPGVCLSDFFLSIRCRKQDAFRQVLSLHRRYGDFVRVGSNTLSITDPNAVDAVYGPQSPCHKADWYDLTQPMVSMQTTRTKAVHAQRRRIWSTAFSAKSLRNYEIRINHFQDILLQQISAFAGQPLDAARWFNLYTFDVMGDLAFGAHLGMMASRKEHWAIQLLNNGLTPLSFLLPIWFFRIMVVIPGLTKDWWAFIAYCRTSLEARMKSKPDVPDVMSALLSSYDSNTPSPDEMQMLCGDSQLIIVAGRYVFPCSASYYSRIDTYSDTTSTTLAFLFYELARHPHHVALLRKEIKSCMSEDGSSPKDQDLQHLAHLNAVINETLRLHPPVPTVLPRLTPPEGLEINGTRIPGNTVVWCPQYAICRSEAFHYTFIIASN